jgi:uncharacterized protein (DUF983 family)
MPGPFDDLDPDEAPDLPSKSATPSGPSAHAERPSIPARKHPNEPRAPTAFARGATRRCPRCGGGHLFETWFRIRTRCPRCGLRLEREEGGFLGAMTINYGVTAIAWLALLIVWLVLDLPDVHVLWLTIASIAVAVLVPLLFWPFSKTIWASVDFLVWRTDPEYGSRAAADRASGNGGRA